MKEDRWDRHFNSSAEAALFDFDIVPFSMQPKTPQDRLNSLMKFVGAIQPLLPLAQQQGAQFNFQGFARLFAKYESFDELDSLMQFGGPDQSNTQQQSPTSQQPPPKMPAAPGPPRTGQSPRRSDGTAGGQENANIAALLGSGGGNNGAKNAA